MRVVLPMSAWWSVESRHRKKSKRPSLATVIRKLQVKKTREAVSRALAEDQANTELGLSPDLIWLFKVVGAIALLKNPRDSSDGKSPWMQEAGDPQASQAELTAYYLHVAEALRDVTKGMDARPLQDSLVHLVSQNRRAGMALFSSVAATKSDAARRLFEIDGSGITWAVIDSGIDARHPAFRNFKTTRSGKVRPITLPKNGDWNDLTRISATYDFNIIRHVLSKNPGDDPKVPPHVKAKLTRDAGRAKSLRKSLESGRDIDWSLVMPLVQVMHDESYEPPSSLLDHGTHVAGILGADWRDEQNKDLQHGVMQGICPDIRMVMVSHMDDDHINGILQMTSQLADLDEKKRRCHLTW
ncbi:MAG: S8 family serine peptidase [Fuerstiella sp.]